MFDIHIDIDDINISSIEREDIVTIQKWINYQQCNFKDTNKPMELKEFYERFLEYYVSEGEFFLKINKHNNLIGILKGRIEFKNPNEVWLWYFLLDNLYRGNGIGSQIIKSLQNYFSNGFGIYNFYTGVCEKDTRALKFWNKNNFKLIRVSKDFFNIDGRNMDMFVLKTEV
ncbi:GNAT family N-acetyltransferase [Clostridium sp. SYSU_GA19001]|uniref:GNAT family N-acetyltransferase n=1 Tax=Clostridium caldaquaticum TaxID=2940653 RepID=UPI0020772AD7|nr:GNAT family N-acetyltransferase [Clostridium caldaquaticum]MCM8710359.1 GNAT family N-acetyltransferase [Clostridium caldaquaticum]